MIFKWHFHFLLFVDLFFTSCWGFFQYKQLPTLSSTTYSSYYTDTHLLGTTTIEEEHERKPLKTITIDYNADNWIDLLDPNIYGRTFLEGKTFLQSLRELQLFKEIHGHYVIPNQYMANPTLGRFVDKVRRQHRHYEMGKKIRNSTVERFLILDQMGFCWDGRETATRYAQTKLNNLWLEKFHQLKDYIDQNNKYKNNTVGAIHMLPDGALRKWVYTQRTEKKKYNLGKKSNLTQERIQYLDSIQFSWTAPSPLSWEQESLSPTLQAKFNNLWLKRFHQLKADWSIFTHQKKDNEEMHQSSDNALRQWVYHQRKEKKKYDCGEKSSLTEERIKYLDSIKFCWAPRERESPLQAKFNNLWLKRFHQLNDYYIHQKNIGEIYKLPDKTLRHWVSTQRSEKQKYDRGEKSYMTEERITYLNSINFCWKAPPREREILQAKFFNNNWLKRFHQLNDYIHQNNGEMRNLSDKTLRDWVYRQRSEKKKYDCGEKSYLTKERIKYLNSIKFCWKAPPRERESPTTTPSLQTDLGNSWLKRFHQLDDYRQQNNGEMHKLPDKTLRDWVYRQRSEKKKYDRGEKSYLTEERIKCLDSFKFCWAPRERESPTTPSLQTDF